MSLIRLPIAKRCNKVWQSTLVGIYTRCPPSRASEANAIPLVKSTSRNSSPRDSGHQLSRVSPVGVVCY